MGSFATKFETWELAWPTLVADTLIVNVSGNGVQRLTLDAGVSSAKRLYWLFGSLTGTSPGVRLVSPTASVTIPLVPDFYTDITIASPNRTFLAQTKGALDASGQARAALFVPKITDPNALGLIFYHAYLVYDANNNFCMASDPVPLKLVK